MKHEARTLGVPTFVVDGSSVAEVASSLGLTEEQREALLVALQGESGASATRAAERAKEDGARWQDEQARGLVERGSWVEVDCHPSADVLKDEEFWDKLGNGVADLPWLKRAREKVRAYDEFLESAIAEHPPVFEDDEPPEEIMERMDEEADAWLEGQRLLSAERDTAFSARPTIHQFYDDLYGAPVLTTEDVEKRGLYVNDLDLQPEFEVLVNHRDRDEPYQLYTDYGEFIRGVERETSFIHMGHFWVPPTGYLLATKNAMTDICGFAVDLDRAEDKEGEHYSADWAIGTLVGCLERHPEVRPNYIMLSGTGVQLWYVFGRAIPLLSAGTRKGSTASPRRGKFDRLLKLLYGFFKRDLPPNRFKVDTACAAINHAFRAPDSPTKLRYQTRLFAYEGRRRQPVDPLALSDFLGGDLEPYDVEDWDQEAYERIREEKRTRKDAWWNAPASEKQVAWLEKLKSMHCVSAELDTAELTKAAADAEIKQGEVVYTRHSQFVGSKGRVTTTNGHTVRLSARHPRLYEFTLENISERTPVGSRYWSLFALAGIAYNCGIPRKRLEADMTELAESDWGRRVSSDRQPVTRKDVLAALKGYCPLGTLRPKEQVESLLAWDYGPSQPRNGRNRAEHLWGMWTDADGREVPNRCKVMRDASLAVERKSRAAGKVGALAEWLRLNPDGSKRAACRELGMSASTVIKYWLEACTEADVEDTRTGNHSPS